MLKRLGLWFTDKAGGAIVGAVIGGLSLTAIVNAAVRYFRILSWEATWVIWTTTFFVGYVLLVRTARWWFGSSLTPEPPKLDYDPKAPKHFSPKDADYLWDVAYDEKKTSGAKSAELKKYIGLWLIVEGVVTDGDHDEGSDGEGGTWASLTINYTNREGKPDQGFPDEVFEIPRPVRLLFMGQAANVARALGVGDRIKAQGRIHEEPCFPGALLLMPAEFLAYPLSAPR